MRLLFIIPIILLASCSNVDVDFEVGDPETIEKNNTEEVREAVYSFNKALVEKDTAALNDLICDELSYGHSNAWVENKQELKADLFNNTLTYHKIDQPELEIVVKSDVATVRGDGIFDVDYKEYEHLTFDLHVMQTWVKQKGAWKMLNRQSTANKK